MPRKPTYSADFIAGVKSGTQSISHLTPNAQVYVTRLARNFAPDVPRSVLRGHPNVKKGEKGLSEGSGKQDTPRAKRAASATPGKRGTTQKPKTTQKQKVQKPITKAPAHKPPKITKRVENFSNGAKIVTSYKAEEVFKRITKLVREPNKAGMVEGKNTRIYFEVFNTKTGEWNTVYFGSHKHRHTANGISAEKFLFKVNDKLERGEASSLEDAIRQVLAEDANKDDSPPPPGEEVDADSIGQIRLYVMPQKARAA